MNFKNRWEVLYDLITSNGYKIFVEIGVARGKTSSYLLKNIEDLKIFAIDPYPKRHIKEEASGVLNHERCVFIEKSSKVAVVSFEDDSLDIVFIDGNHKLSFVKFDVGHWWNKVRVGGILSGHDYNVPTVRKVVNLFCRRRGVDLNLESDNVWWVRK